MFASIAPNRSFGMPSFAALFVAYVKAARAAYEKSLELEPNFNRPAEALKRLKKTAD